MYAHERPDVLVPWEWEWSGVVDGATVLVSKVGGGTLGRRYAGAWHYAWTRGDRCEQGSDLFTGTGYTHEEAARVVVDTFGEVDA